MIDRRRRDRLAEALRHFAAGLLTNDEYEERVDRTFEGMGPSRKEDLALWAVYNRAWFLYDDLRTHRLTGQWALTAGLSSVHKVMKRRGEILVCFVGTDRVVANAYAAGFRH